MTNIAEIQYELLLQLLYKQYYAEIEGKLPIFVQRSYSQFREIFEIFSDVDEAYIVHTWFENQLEVGEKFASDLALVVSFLPSLIIDDLASI